MIKNNIYSKLLLLVSGLLVSNTIVYGMDNGFDLDAFRPDRDVIADLPNQIDGLVGTCEQQVYYEQFALPAQFQEPTLHEPDKQDAAVLAIEGSIGNIKRHKHLCLDCGRTFRVPALLNDHMRAHTGEKPFACQKCNKRFSQRSNLTKHMKTHTGKKPYKCSKEGCGKKFSQNSDLTMHVRTHTGEQPFKCEICEMSFSQRGNRKRHMKTHNYSEEEQKSEYEEGYL